MQNNLSFQVHPGAGPHLLLAHGVLSNSAQWTLNLQALGQFCTPVTVELLGHGDSPAPDHLPAYEPDAYVDQFEHIRETLGAECWFLCGYSLGASLTLRYALKYPQHVFGHLLTNSNSAFADEQQSQEWLSAGAKTLQRAATDGMRFIEKLPIHPRFATSLPKAVYAPLLARAKLLHPVGASRAMAITAPHASVRELVHTNTRPALLLHGVRERAFRDHASFAAATMPQLQVVELDAGHGVNMQAADSFNSAVQAFVTETINACAT